jgi:hypothetical protein
MSVPGSRPPAGQKGSPLMQHVAVQRRVMVFLGLVHMLMTVPNFVFLFMRPPSDTLWLLLELPAPD